MPESDRLDFYKEICSLREQMIQVVFTHESQLWNNTVRKYLQWFGEYAVATGCVFGYPDLDRKVECRQ